MKSQKGMTMISLILYIGSFLAITAVIAGITTFFYGNMEVLDSSTGSNSQYNKFNLYMLNECKKENNILLAWRESDESKDDSRLDQDSVEDISNKFIVFKNTEDGEKNSFIYDEDNDDLYYNHIRLCDDVEDFQIKVDNVNEKSVLKIFIKIAGTVFSTEYVVKQ